MKPVKEQVKKVYRRYPPHPIDIRLAEMGHNRAWLAKRIRYSPTYIGMFCRRKLFLRPDAPITLDIKQALGVDLDYLIIGPGPKTRNY